MRAITQQITDHGADLVLVGSGNVQEAEEFLRETETEGLRLLVDPELKGYRAAALRRSLLAPFSPRSWWEALKLFLRGERPGRLAGDAYQLGGLFVISPLERVEFAHRADSISDRLPLGDVLLTLERMQREGAPRRPTAVGT